jgi:hypothetical protein
VAGAGSSVCASAGSNPDDADKESASAAIRIRRFKNMPRR